MRNQFIPSRINPITPGATPETVQLLRWLANLGRRRTVAMGANDMLKGNSSTDPLSFYELDSVFAGNAGGASPAIMGFEYHDPTWTAAWGATGTSAVAAKIVAAANAGKAVALHHHSGHPVTGALSRVGTFVWPARDGGDAGTSWDLTAGGLASVLAGGSQDAQLLAYLDRLATFIDGLVDNRGRKIPVILRLWHEANGGWFWWGASAANYRALWQRTVTYLRDTKGLTNVLYAPCVSSDVSIAGWYPCDSFTDVFAIDNYDNSASPSLSNAGRFATCYAECVAATAKPLFLAEFGYQNWTTATAPVWAPSIASLADNYSRIAAAMVWRSPFGPSSSDAASKKADFSAALRDPRALTL